MATFSYFSEDDALQYDYDAAMPILNELGTDLTDLTSKLSTLIDHLGALQDHCHDKEGSNITEDFKDFSALIGDESSGISGYILDADSLCHDIHETLEEWHRQTHN